MHFSTIADIALFYLVSLGSMGFVGYGPTVLFSEGNLRRHRYLIAPLIGFCTTAVLSSLLNSTFLNMQQATWVILGLAAVLNLYAVRKTGLGRPRLSLETAGVAALTLVTYIICSIPLIKEGTTTFVGLQWDLELYVPITEYLKRYVVAGAILGPSNPLLESLNAPAFRGGSGWGFSYVEAFVGSILSWPSFETFRPMLHFTLSLSVPALYVFSRSVFKMSRSASLLAAAFWSLNGLPIWIASIGLAGHTVSFFALPLALATGWNYFSAGERKGVVLAALAVAGLLLSFYTGAAPLLAICFGSIFLYQSIVTSSRLALLARGLGIAALVLSMAIFGHLRFLEVLPLYFENGFSSGWHVTEYSTPAELLGLYPYAGVFGRPGFRGPHEPIYLADFAMAASLAICFFSLFLRGWDKRALLVFGIPYLIFLAYLRYISHYPYGFFKALSLGYFLLVPLLAQGLMFLVGKTAFSSDLPGRRSQLFNKIRATPLLNWGIVLAYLGISIPLMLGNLSLSVYYFWRADWDQLPKSVWELESMKGLLPPGEKVYMPDSKGYDKRLAGMVSYFLIDNPMIGRVDTAYGNLRAGQLDKIYGYLLLPPGNAAAERGLGMEDLVWQNELVGLYKVPKRWLADLEMDDTDSGPVKMNHSVPLVINLNKDGWLVTVGDRTYRGPYWGEANWQQLELSFLGLGDLEMSVDVDGMDARSLSPDAGPFTYRTDTLILPSVVTIRTSNPDTSLWLRSMRITQPTYGGPSLVYGDRFMALAMSTKKLDGVSQLAVEYAARDTEGGDMVLAAELYSTDVSGEHRTPVYYRELARVHSSGSSKAYLPYDLFRSGMDGGSRLGEGRYEGHLAVYYVNQELARLRLATFDSAGAALEEEDDGIEATFMLYYLPLLKDLEVVKGLVPAGSEMFLSTLTHPDRSFIRVAASRMDDRKLYAAAPLAASERVTLAELGNIYDYALLDIGEASETYGYTPSDRLWNNDEVALYKRGKDGAIAVFAFGMGSGELSIAPGNDLNMELAASGIVVSNNKDQFHSWEHRMDPQRVQVELLLATVEKRKIIVEQGSFSSTIDLAPGLTRYRTVDISGPDSLLVRTDGPLSILTLIVGELGPPLLQPLPGTVAMAAVSALHNNSVAVSDITYYGPRDEMTSIGIDVYATEDQGHFGWWATSTSLVNSKMRMRLDLPAREGSLLMADGGSPDLASESWSASNGSYRASLQVKRGEQYHAVTAFDFELKGGVVSAFRPLKAEAVMPGT